ncbi:transcriptional regulator, TetR family [Denitrovibrio acetiphilus DSM 12809]|uniref:Transcriptional regulator, TetR family n=1 Tax=Denitrovibrio acetiphilus (strain DSM 12809 / NBRC 114555 / N2460) TaxID=522772 RepID=D4H8W1_DENA2|nr:TetR/AcrR family transcriptional regulator [Denitrovibrio acetiphilus]ADD68460.1 transcriptional regulator, TetR family [Denitrovibrio acetiphilus DSM 12809]
MTWINGEFEAKQQRADEKKKKILDAALEMFGNEGYYKTTAKEIASRAGVATGTFYRYFKDKKAVLMAVCHRTDDEISREIFQTAAELRKAGVSERKILDNILESAVKAHHMQKGFHLEILSLQMRDKDIMSWVDDRERKVFQSITDFLRSSHEPLKITDLKAAAEIISYTIETIAHRAVLMTPYTDEKRLIGELQEMMARYIYGDRFAD